MSDYDNRKEEWTRRKSYLLRSLFEDQPMLSTISEEDESVTQYSPRTPRENARHLETIDRPPSPLPDLIIEFVPKRPKIYDDEPDEFYERLEKQMKRLYRRDYLNQYSSSSDNETQIDHELRTFEDDYCVPDLDDSHKEKSINGEEHCIEQNEFSPTLHDSSAGKSTSSTSFSSTNKIETTAVIEREIEPSYSSNKYTQSNNASSRDNTAEVAESANEDEFEDEEHDISMELAENTGASSSNESVSTIPGPDAMRRQEARLSLFSVTNQDFEMSPEKLVLYQGKQLIFMEDSLDNHDSNITTHNLSDVRGKATSTPKSRREANYFRLSNRKSFSDRFEPYSTNTCPSGNSFIPKCDRALQTSFSEEESENQSLWRNFFIGKPVFFRLQS